MQPPARPVICLFLLTLLVAFSTFAQQSRAGWIEEKDGRTIIHVVVAILPDPGRTDTASRANVAAVRLFKQRFPEIFKERYRERYRADPRTYGQRDWENVDVELHPFSALQVEGVETDLLAIAGELAPDVLYVNFRKSDNYIRNNFLYPLDKPQDGYLSAMTPEEIAFRINPKLWQVIQRKGPQGSKQVWALPFAGALGKVLLYRKDLFDEKNLPYPTEDWTWDDLLAASKILTDPARGRYGLALGAGKHESWFWVTFLWSAGGEAMVYDEPTDQWRCVFDTDEAVTALDFYTRLSAERWTDSSGKLRRGYAYKDADTGTKWERGEIGMTYSYVDEKMFSTINPDLVGMIPVPKGPTGLRGGELNSMMMGLFSDIKEIAVRDAAWEYMRFFECEEAVGVKTKIMVEGGLGRFVNPKYLRMFGYPEIERLAPPGWSRTFDVAMETGKPEPFGKNSNFAYDLMTVPIQQAGQLALNDQLPLDHAARRDVLRGLLQSANARANEEMIGAIPAPERTRRRGLAAVMLGVIVLGFAVVFWKISRVFAGPTSTGAASAKSAWRRYIWAYVILLPALLTILLWQYFPLARGSVMAFQDYRLLGESMWVGLDNFGDLMVSGFWWQSVWNSIRYSLLVIGLTFLPPILLAILLQEVPRAKVLFRTIYYLPAVVTGLVVTLLWKQFYDPSETGMLNALVLHVPAFAFVLTGAVLSTIAILFGKRMWYHDMRLASILAYAGAVVMLVTAMGLAWPILFPPGVSFVASLQSLPLALFRTMPEPVRWLADPGTAMLACVIPMVWAGMGPGCLIYLAALKGVPDDYYDAADVDGATFIDKILFVVFPILKPLIIINFVGVFIGSFYGAGGNILAMTGGGANTEVADLSIWYKAFTFLNFGQATAMAWMLGFMLIGFTVYQLRILSRVEFRTTGGKT